MPIFRLARSSFDPDTLAAMSKAFDEACAALNLVDEQGREAIATRIINLARGGTIAADALRDRVIQESQKSKHTTETCTGSKPSQTSQSG